MKLLAVSINHRTAPVELREAVYLTEAEIKAFIKEAKEKLFKEGLVLSTCNRTEIYGVPQKEGITHIHIQDFLQQNKSAGGLRPEHFQNLSSQEAVKHLFNISTGIDSMLIGDNQILKQVKNSFQIAAETHFAGFMMKRVFDAAIHAGKRAIAETRISDGAVTVSYAAIQLIEKIFSNLNKKSALVIGAGETGEIAAKHLKDKNIGKLGITNRTTEKAIALAEKLNAEVLPFPDYINSLHKYDVIISATSSPDILLHKDVIEKTMKNRNYESMILMDIAVPRDIDPETKKIDYVFYHDIDSLNIIVKQNLSRRKAEIPKVEKIVEEELANLFEWYNSLQAGPTIKSIRDLFEEIRTEEVEKNINRFSSDDKEKLEIITKRIINKILHHPTTLLRKTGDNTLGKDESASKIGIIRELFGIDKKDDGEKLS
ncbi:MAG: glutamyl-tRNA reductase [Ignavibacteria bacterium]|nr:glutamyl-tRNA reductase [Ignavibacteria bacterium]